MVIYQRKYAQQGIPLVPMLDILTILLIFFIVHTEFKKQVSVLEIEVPKTAHLAGSVHTRDGLLLEINAAGDIALNGSMLSLDELANHIKSIAQQSPQQKILLAAADGVSLGVLVSVMDKLTEAGMDVEEIPFRIDYGN